ncbi:MAG: hypothetical protein ACWGIK_14580 [Achromobacter pulmonis]
MRVYQFRHLGADVLPSTSLSDLPSTFRLLVFRLFATGCVSFRVQQQRNEIMHTFLKVCKSCGIFFTFFEAAGFAIVLPHVTPSLPALQAP